MPHSHHRIPHPKKSVGHLHPAPSARIPWLGLLLMFAAGCGWECSCVNFLKGHIPFALINRLNYNHAITDPYHCSILSTLTLYAVTIIQPRSGDLQVNQLPEGWVRATCERIGTRGRESRIYRMTSGTNIPMWSICEFEPTRNRSPWNLSHDGSSSWGSPAPMAQWIETFV